jgi:hypothetical protein
MKKITIFTTLLSAVVMCGMVFSGCYTYLAAGQGDDRNDPWVERWSGWYAQDLERYDESDYPNTVIVNRYWHSTDMHSFRRNVYDWYRGCWVVEPEFRLSIAWTDGWFDWDFGWDWNWGHAYRPVFWHPPVWAVHGWYPPMAHCGWWPHHEWTRPFWGEWRHGHEYAYDHGSRHAGWMNDQTYYPDQPRIQARRSFASRRASDLRRRDRLETASWNAPSSRDSRRSGFQEWSGGKNGDLQTRVPDRVIENNRGTGRQAVRREYRTIEPVQRTQTRFPDRESRPSANRELRTPDTETRLPNPEFRSTTFGEAHSSRRTGRTESRTPDSGFRNLNAESRNLNPEPRDSRRTERGDLGSSNSDVRTPDTEPRSFRRAESVETRSPQNSEFQNPNTEPRRNPDPEPRSSRREFHIQNTESRNPNPGFRSTTFGEARSSRRIERTESRTPNTEFRTSNNESRFPNREYRSPNTESRFPKTEFRSPNPEPRNPNPENRSSRRRR